MSVMALEYVLCVLDGNRCYRNGFVSKKILLLNKKTDFVFHGQLLLVKQPVLFV